MLSPKRSKFRKQFKGRIHGIASSGALLNFGHFGLKALEPERITARQIEAAHGNVNFSDFFVRPNYSVNLTDVTVPVTSFPR